MSTTPEPIAAVLSPAAVNAIKQVMSVPFTKDWLENMRVAKFNRSLPSCDLGAPFTREQLDAWRASRFQVTVNDNVRDLIRRAIKNALDKELIGAIGELDEICEALRFEP